MKQFFTNLQVLGPKRLTGIAIVGVLILGIIGFVVVHGATQPMALLYGDMDLRDSAQVAATLDKLRVPYEIRAGGAQVLVPSDQVDRLRLALAREGLPAGGSIGYEVFDRGDSLTSNQFQQQINQLRALEGELGRTIRAIQGVRNARVHLVLPKREPFARDQQHAQASIVLAMAGAQRMNDEEVLAIVNLVAMAVPGLKPQNISVVDSRGQLLTQSGRSADADGTSRNDDVRRTTEQHLGQEVEALLSRTLGPGHVRAIASVEMDFDHVNETQERYDPDGQVIRRQQNVKDANKSSDPQPTVSVQNNLPNPDGQAGSSATASNRQEEDTTFEIGKTTRTVVRNSPQIKKVSVAVLVDGTTTLGPDGKPSWQALSSADLDRLATLVRSAVGFDEKRGDKVEVVNMRFSEPDEIGPFESAGSSWLQIGKADIFWLVSAGLIALVALFALAFVVRPLALKLAAPMPSQNGLPLPGPGMEEAGSSMLSGPLTSHLLQSSPSIESADRDTMLNVPNIQGEIRAASIRALGQLVEQHEDASVTVVRGWLAQKAG